MSGRTHACACDRVNIDFKDTEPLGLSLFPVEHDSVGTKVQIKTPKYAVPHLRNQIRDLARAQIEYAEVATKAAAPVNKVRVEVAGMIGIAFNENEFV